MLLRAVRVTYLHRAWQPLLADSSSPEQHRWELEGSPGSGDVPVEAGEKSVDDHPQGVVPCWLVEQALAPRLLAVTEETPLEQGFGHHWCAPHQMCCSLDSRDVSL